MSRNSYFDLKEKFLVWVVKILEIPQPLKKGAISSPVLIDIQAAIEILAALAETGGFKFPPF